MAIKSYGKFRPVTIHRNSSLDLNDIASLKEIRRFNLKSVIEFLHIFVSNVQEISL